MKKKATMLLGVCTLLVLSTFTYLRAQDQPIGFDYMARGYLVEDDGYAYYVSECTPYKGNDCTTPGSATRINLTYLLDVFK